MAAIIEVRGRIRRYETATRATPQLTLRVHSRQLNLIARMGKLTGVEVRVVEANIIDDPANRRGCIVHCPEPHIHTRIAIPGIGMWNMVGAAAAIVLHNLMPYLTEDVTEIQSFIDDAIANLPVKQQGRHAVVTAANRLASLGWAIPVEIEHWIKGPQERIDVS